MATVLGKIRAGARAASEVLFVGQDGELREGGTSNVFVRQDEVWRTHPTDGSILAGVTRGAILDLLRADHVKVVEEAPLMNELDSWQEAFLCGTTTGVQPLVEIDGVAVAGGVPGPWTKRVAEAFDAFERRLIAAA